MIFEIVTIIAIILGFLIFGYIISSKLKSLKVEPDTKIYGDITSKLSNLKTTVEQTAKYQEKIEEKRDASFKENMDKHMTELINFSRMMSGTQERGKIGENILNEILNPFIKANKVIKNLNIDNKNVEFAWKINQNKYIPIDSKLPDVLGLYKKYTEEKDKNGQLELKKSILKKIESRIEDVKKYRNKKNTTDKVILAIPDAIFELIPEINSEANKINVYVCGYHMIVYVASYIEREYLIIVDSGDVGEYKESVDSILRLIEEIKDKTKTIDKGVIMIKNANDEIKESSMEAEHQKPKTIKKIIVKNKVKEIKD